MIDQPGREEAILEAVLDLSPEQRRAYLDQACAGNPGLRELVEALLLAHRGANATAGGTAAPAHASTIRVALSPVEKPGDRLGHYKLLEERGQGGMGTVWLAEQTEPVRRKVAIKVIKLGMDTAQVIARFEAERQALALMDHPNIAKVLDAGATETGRPYFVMEFVAGEPITEFCDRYRLSTQQRLDLFAQVCKAVQHAHQKGIIHRDIKPGNILVTLQDGTPMPKVIDFGIAKATAGQRLTERTLHTAMQEFIGTPTYMSPEQAELTGLDIDTRSDIYSLGVLLYELLTGRTPFESKRLVKAGLDEIRRIIREEEPPRPSTKLSTMKAEEQTTVARSRQSEPPKLIHLVRGDLDWIVMKCLEKDRGRRYETANGLAADLQRFVNDEPVVARPPSKAYRLKKLVRRNRLAFAAAGAVAGALLVGIGASTWLLLKEKQARQRAVAAEHAQSLLRQETERALLRAETGERNARREALKSQQVAQFLKDMLEGLDPSAALGRDTSLLREIVDKTAKRVGQDLRDQPELEAELTYTLGAVYWGIGEYPKAEVLFRKLLVLHRKMFGEENVQVASALNDLAVMLEPQHKLEEAETLHRQALAMRRKLLGNEHLDVAESLLGLSSVLWRQGNLGEAEKFNREALAMYQKLRGPDSGESVKALNNLAAILREESKTAEAEKAFRQVLAVYQKLYGPVHPLIATVLNNLAFVLQDQDQFAPAETTLLDAVAMSRRLFHNQHEELATELDNLAMVQAAEGKFELAEANEKESLAMRRKLGGEENPMVVPSLNGLARIFCDEGRLAEAEAIQRQAVTLGQKVLGKNQAAVMRGLGTLTRVLREQGKLEEAERVARTRLESLRATLGPADPRLAEPLGGLTVTLLQAKKFAEAESSAHEWLGVVEKWRPGDWRDFQARGALGASLLGQAKFGDAEPLLLVSYAGLKEQADRIPAGQRSAGLEEAVARLIQLCEDTGQADQVAHWKTKLTELAADRAKPASATQK